MDRRRHWIRLAVALSLAGLLLGGAALALMGFDFTGLSTVRYVTNTCEVEESFRDIAVRAGDAKVAFAPSEDGRCRVVCREDEKRPHSVRVEGDALTVAEAGEKGWALFSLSLGEDPAITVYLPEAAYGALSVTGDTGDVDIPGDFAFDSIDVKLDTGDVSCRASSGGDIAIRTDTGRITASDLSARDMELTSDTGDVALSRVTLAGGLTLREDTGKAALEAVVASGGFDLESDTGSVRFDGCDAGTIRVKTDTGDVTGTLLTAKAFAAKSGSGKVEVPVSGEGGRCEITTGTGDIRLEVP